MATHRKYRRTRQRSDRKLHMCLVLVHGTPFMWKRNKLKINCITNAPPAHSRYTESGNQISTKNNFLQFLSISSRREKSIFIEFKNRNHFVNRSPISWALFRRLIDIICARRVSSVWPYIWSIGTYFAHTHTHSKAKRADTWLECQSHNRAHAAYRLCELWTAPRIESEKREEKTKLSNCKLYTNLFRLVSSIYSAIGVFPLRRSRCPR